MSIKNKICLGVIADDFTGASDAASFLVKSGRKVIVYTRLPKVIPKKYDGIVIALKSRSVNPKDALLQTKEAFAFLKKANVEHYYFKYGSTFDSTRSGNIGVVLDYLIEELDVPYTILCPSLPVNGRTVKNGLLYVNGIKLSESSMKDHPLNPMWDSYIPNLMREQSKYPCFILSRKDMENEKVDQIIQKYESLYQKFYLIPDYESADDAILIRDHFNTLTLMSGGSGLLEHLFPKQVKVTSRHAKQTHQKAVIVCGSCSKMSQEQIQHFRSQGGITYPIDSKELRTGTICAADVFAYIASQDTPVLVYSDAVDKNIRELSKAGTYLLESNLMETLMADISVMACNHRFTKIIVAGGETSGAVAKSLGYDAYEVGEAIAPGVPELRPLLNKELCLILKSGNFGDVDFFEKALGMEGDQWNKG